MGSSGSRRFKDALIGLALAILPLYFKHFPIQQGKVFIWKRIVMRRLIWQRMPLSATSWFGARFDVRFPDILQTYLYFFGIWEPVISKYLFDRLGEGDIFIDVGANVGYHTLLASGLVGAKGKVFAIEASGSTYAKLQKNLLQNKANNVTAFHVAVSDVPGQLPVWVSDKGDSPGTTTLSHVAEQRETLKMVEIVDAKPLAQIIDIDTIRKARFIKIDVEGAEWAVVKSLGEIIKTASPQTEFIIEVDDQLVRRSGGTVKAFLDYFSAAGFEPFVIPNRYDAAFFANKVGRVELQRFDGRKFGQIDLVFRRAAASADS